MVCGTDSFGAYIWSATRNQWTQLLTTSVLSGTTPADLLSAGCDDIKIDPSNSSNIWMLTNGQLYKSTNKAVSFSLNASYPLQTAYASGGSPTKAFGPYLAIDPNNSSVVYASSTSNGLWVTNDGATFSQVVAVSTALPGNINNNPTPPVSGIGGGHRICFDVSVGTTTVSGQTRTKNIYVHTYGVGVYKSTDGGVTWSLLNSAGMPTCIRRMACDPYGVLWVVDDMYSAFTNLSKYDAGWTVDTHIGASGTRWFTSVAVDVTNSPSKGATRVVYIQGDNEYVAFSIDGGSSWNLSGGNANRSFVSSGDVDWLLTNLQANSANFFANCDAVFDPLNSGRCYTGAEGVWYFTPPSVGAAITLTQQTRGIEQFIGINILSTPATPGAVLMGTWDFPCFYSSSLDTYPSVISGAAGASQPGLLRGYSFDWVWNSPSTVVGIVQAGDNTLDYSGKSASGGTAGSWTQFTTLGATAKGGGQIAAVDSLTYLWVADGNSGIPKMTTDGGVTWNAISIPGGTPSSFWGAIANYATTCKVCDSDKANGNLYLYNANTGSGSDAIFKYTKTTGLWSTVVTPTGFVGQANFNEQIKSSGVADVIFFTGGLGDPPHPATKPFYFTNDGWVTKSSVANFNEVHAFGFGAFFGGQSFPSIYAAGWYSGVYGIYMCKNFNPATGAGTWVQIGESYPTGVLSTVAGIDGDKVTPGRVYVMTSAGGAFWGYFT